LERGWTVTFGVQWEGKNLMLLSRRSYFQEEGGGVGGGGGGYFQNYTVFLLPLYITIFFVPVFG